MFQIVDEDSWPFTGLIKVAGLLLLVIAVVLGVFIFNKVTAISEETSRERESRVLLAKQETELESRLKDIEQSALADFMSRQYSKLELYDIGKKYFLYDIRVNGTAINSGNAQMNIEDTDMELVIIENIKSSVFPTRISKEISPFSTDNLVSEPPVTITSTKAAYTESIEYLGDKTVKSYLFKELGSDEIVTVVINNPDIVKAVGLETNVIKVFAKHKD